MIENKIFFILSLFYFLNQTDLYGFEKRYGKLETPFEDALSAASCDVEEGLQPCSVALDGGAMLRPLKIVVDH